MSAPATATAPSPAVRFYREEIEPHLTFELVYGNDVKLKWRGSQGRGPCPLHGGDNDTAFVVDADSLTWCCWTRCKYVHGIGHGDALDYVRLRHGLGFYEAIDWLRERLGDAIHDPVTPRPTRDRRMPLPPGRAEALWSVCARVTDDALVAEWIRERFGGRVDPARVEDLDLARALSYSVDLPWWAMSWRDVDRTGADVAQYRLIVPMYDAAGRMESLRARSVRRVPISPKEKAPLGFTSHGLLMADPLARRLLAGDRDAAELVHDAGVWIAEGLTDFLALACAWGAADVAPAVLGIVNGSWTAEHAARIPDGSTVTIATDADETGEGYAEDVIASLRGRRVRVGRWAP